jgi:uncharacterized radical SAM superfamily Fe-S cluster-containing enzyme
VFLATVFVQAVHASEEFTKEEQITLQKYTFRDGGEKKLIKLGEKVTFEINAYIGEFLKEPIINANAKITNTTSVHMNTIYVIRFYDANNRVIGAHAMDWTLKPNEDINYGSALIRGKEEDFRRVKYYKLYTCAYETLPKK